MGNKIIGKIETIPKGNPSFVQRVTKKATSPIKIDCVVLKVKSANPKC